MCLPPIFRVFPACLIFFAPLARAQSAPSLATPEPWNPATIKGRVTDANGKPLAGVRIEIDKDSKGSGHPKDHSCEYKSHTSSERCDRYLTDHDGKYRIFEIAPRLRFILYVQAPGFAAIGRGNIELKPGETSRQDFILTQPASTVNSSLRLEWKVLNGDGLQNIFAIIELTGHGLRQSSIKRNNSRYYSDIFELPKPGDYVLRVSAPGFLTEQLHFVISENNFARITFRLCAEADQGCNRAGVVTIQMEPLNAETITVRGFVRDRKGNPIAEAVIRADGPAGSKAVETSTDGSYQILWLNPGEYRLRFWMYSTPEIESQVAQVVLIQGSAGQTVTQNFILDQ